MRIRRWIVSCMVLAMTLVMTMPACAAEKEKLDAPSGVTLDEDGASWEEVTVDNDKTVKYEVQLYKGSSKYIASKSTSDLWASFEDSIAKHGTGYYKIRVRAICSGYTTSSWSDKSDEYYVDNDLLEQYKADSGVTTSNTSNTTSGSSGTSVSSNSSGNNFSITVSANNGTSNTQKKLKSGWYQDRAGWWYVDDQGIVAAHEWKKIQGKWYYFGGNGYMLTGWLNNNGTLYYLDGTGAMVTGSKEIGGVTYQFDANGAKQ